MFDTSRATAHAGGEGYPLRPELVESFVHACVDTPNFKRGLGFCLFDIRYQATRDPIWISYGLDVLQAIPHTYLHACVWVVFYCIAGDTAAQSQVWVCAYKKFEDQRAQ